MGERTSIYLELAKEHYAWDRHHEAQRSTICTIVIIFAGLLLSAAELSGGAVSSKKVLGSLIIIAGLFGIVFVYKQYERMKRHKAGFEWYKGLIGEELNIDFSKEKMSLQNDERYARFSWIFRNVPLHYYWSFLMLFVVLIGFYVVFSPSVS